MKGTWTTLLASNLYDEENGESKYEYIVKVKSYLFSGANLLENIEIGRDCVVEINAFLDGIYTQVTLGEGRTYEIDSFKEGTNIIRK